MTKIEELQRKAVLHRQAGTVLRGEADRHDGEARGIDGGLSEAEKGEIRASLKNLLLAIEKGTLEYRLARLEMR